MPRHAPLKDDALALVAQRFRVLSEPLRLKLIQSLSLGERTVGQLVAESGASQTNTSRQLQILAQAGILSRRKEGLQVFYAIADPSIFDLCLIVCGSVQEHHQVRAQAVAAPRRRRAAARS